MAMTGFGTPKRSVSFDIGPERSIVDVERITLIQLDEPGDPDRLLSAACNLGTDEMRTRLGEWAAVRDRSREIRRVPGGAVLALGPDERMEDLADLLERESQCCGIYTFTLTIDGPSRELTVVAGPGRDVAVHALLGIG